MPEVDLGLEVVDDSWNGGCHNDYQKTSAWTYYRVYI